MAIIPSTLNTGLSSDQVMEAFGNALTHVPGTSEPAMDGTGSAGSADTFSRSDHVHPTDTSRASAKAEAEDRAALVELVNSGAKNVLDLSKATNVTVGTGISYTLVDGILTVSWTGLQDAKTLKFKSIPHIDGSYVLSGAQTETDPAALRADIRQGATASDVIVMDYGQSDREPFTFQEGVFDYVIRVQTESGTATYKPMICSVPAWKISQAYQPHRPSYQELYERVVALEQAQQ